MMNKTGTTKISSLLYIS